MRPAFAPTELDEKPCEEWSPYNVIDTAEKTKKKSVTLKVSHLSEALIRLRDGGGIPFTMHRRPYLYPIYDCWHKRMVVAGGRQIEKSSLLSNVMLIPAAAIRGYRTLYVSPTDKHTRTFAYDKFDGTLNASPLLTQYLGKPRIDNLYHKEFANTSSVLLRSAYLTATSARGIPADQLEIDEAQEMIASHIPVLQETLTHSHQEEFGRRIVIAGTALTSECLLGEYFEDHSTQGEWVLKCSSGHENIVDIPNLGPTGIICSHSRDGTCAKPLDPLTGRWVHQYPSRKGVYVGYRIPQVINPVVLDHWEDIVLKLRTYSNARIYNEVLGKSYDSGSRPVTWVQLKAAETVHPISKRIQFVESPLMGVDWGYGDVSYTVVTIGGWNERNKFRVIYAKKYKIGDEIDPEYQLLDILKLAREFKVGFIGTDYGAGWGQNSRLKAKFGAYCADFIYAHNLKTKVKWNKNVKRYTANRSETMADTFEAIKTGNIEFYNGYVDEFGPDFVNVSTAQDTMGRTLYTHAPSRPDDAVHSLNYAFLIARIMRRDIVPVIDDELGI